MEGKQRKGPPNQPRGQMARWCPWHSQRHRAPSLRSPTAQEPPSLAHPHLAHPLQPCSLQHPGPAPTPPRPLGDTSPSPTAFTCPVKPSSTGLSAALRADQGCFAAERQGRKAGRRAAGTGRLQAGDPASKGPKQGTLLSQPMWGHRGPPCMPWRAGQGAARDPTPEPMPSPTLGPGPHFPLSCNSPDTSLCQPRVPQGCSRPIRGPPWTPQHPPGAPLPGAAPGTGPAAPTADTSSHGDLLGHRDMLQEAPDWPGPDPATSPGRGSSLPSHCQHLLVQQVPPMLAPAPELTAAPVSNPNQAGTNPSLGRQVQASRTRVGAGMLGRGQPSPRRMEEMTT